MVALTSAPVAFKPALLQQKSVRASRVQRVAVRAVSDNTAAQDALVKTAAFASVATSFLAAGHAQAAVEVANIAAGDGRSGLLFLPLAAALGWVGFNIAGPALNQIDNMSTKSVAAGLGLGAATLLVAQNADAATEAMQLAAGDSRAGLLFLPLTAALGWVGFNILGPATNQISNMSAKKKGVAAGLGLGAASLLAAQSADAATEVMQLAGGDSRAGLLFLPLTAAIGWVLFNILGPATNQINDMSAKKKGVAAGLGLGAASLLAAQSADAATEVMQLAGGDSRAGLLFVPLGAAIGWVLFNILGPATNQINDMSNRKKSVAAGLGLGAASLLAAQSADAATEVMQLAGGDGRAGLLFLPLTAAIGWVLFNILGPASNQISNMAAKNKGLVAGLGLGAASMLVAQNADAATEVMQLAAGDGRSGLLFLPLTAALGWVGFNIAGPALNQINTMSSK